VSRVDRIKGRHALPADLTLPGSSSVAGSEDAAWARRPADRGGDEPDVVPSWRRASRDACGLRKTDEHQEESEENEENEPTH
jgi:hypothetical protein